MAADLDRCNGCGACVVACHAENNISTVGAEQAARGRAKHWIRVERYWEGDFPDVRLKFRPVMCQQCDNAPCEPVCPTYASHHTEDGPQRAGLQPLHRHAVLRQRVSVQRAVLRLLQPVLGQAAPAAAQSGCVAARSGRDGEVHVLRAAHQGGADPGEGRRTASCATARSSRPASSRARRRALVFGDLEDPESEVSRLSRSPRGSKLLEDVGTQPKVAYLARLSEV